MQVNMRVFWVLFGLFMFFGVSLLTIGFAAAQEVGFDLDEGVAEDAPNFDPFVVYEWAASGASCRLSPELLGAVGHAASYHGQLDGYEYGADGTIEPALFGESGDGSRSNLATLLDTDFGAIDDDVFWDRPVGPFQLLPISWRSYGGDANSDGVEDPQNLWDASAAGAEFLCAMGAGSPDDLTQAVRSYAGSDQLAQQILSRYAELVEDSPLRSLAAKSDVEEVDEPELNDPFDHIFDSSGSADEDFDELVGDWNGDGVATKARWEVSGSSFMWMSPVAVAVPLDDFGRPYGAQVRAEVSEGAEAFAGDWNDDGYDSIAIRQALTDVVDVVEFYNRFGRIEGNVVLIGHDDGVDDIWAALQPDSSELRFFPVSDDAAENDESDPTTHPEVVPETSLTSTAGEEIDLVRVEGILVNSEIADAVGEMIADAADDGVALSGWGWRSNARQIELRIQNCEDPWETPSSECSPPTARPGHSRHERGLAIDFHVEGRAISRLDPAFVWLEQHAGEYGLFNLPSEPWHWSVDGR